MNHDNNRFYVLLLVQFINLIFAFFILGLAFSDNSTRKPLLNWL